MTSHSSYRPGPEISITGAWAHPTVCNLGDTIPLMLTISTSITSPSDYERLPIDLTLVLDRSASMAGERLELVKDVTLEAAEFLGPDDTFSVVMFESMAQELILPSPGTIDSRRRLAAALRDVEPGGSTNLHAGWQTGSEHLGDLMQWEETPHIHRAVLVTDGIANAGLTDPQTLTVHANILRQRGITTSTMGIGYGFNEVLLSDIAEAGGGNFTYISRPDEVKEFFQWEVCGLLDVALPQPRLKLTLPSGMRARLINPFPSQYDGADLLVALRDLGVRDTLTLVFDVWTQPGEPGELPEPRVEIELPHCPDTHGRVGTIFDPLYRVEPQELSRFAPNMDVQVQAACFRADRHHRVALRVEREERFNDAREFFGSVVRTLEDAPPTEKIIAEQQEAMYLFASAGNLGENTRKERVFWAMHRSRGHVTNRPKPIRGPEVDSPVSPVPPRRPPAH